MGQSLLSAVRVIAESEGPREPVDDFLAGIDQPGPTTLRRFVNAHFTEDGISFAAPEVRYDDPRKWVRGLSRAFVRVQYTEAVDPSLLAAVELPDEPNDQWSAPRGPDF